MSVARLRKICSARITETTAAMPAAVSLQPCWIQRSREASTGSYTSGWGTAANLSRAARERGRSRRRPRARPAPSSDTPEAAQHLVVVLAQQRGPAAVEPVGPAGEPHRQRAVPGGAGDRVVDVLEEAAVLQLAAASPARAAAAPSRRARPPPTGSRRSRRRSARRTSSTGGRRWRRAAAAGRRRSSAPGPSPTPGRPSASRRPSHCSSVATAIATQASRSPASSASAVQVEVLRRGGRARGCRPARGARRRPSAPRPAPRRR